MANPQGVADAAGFFFDRLYPPIVDDPTPPDFDAALDDLETRASLYHSSGGPNRTHYRNDLTAARQRVRELHEAVVRERDVLKADTLKIDEVRQEMQRRYEKGLVEIQSLRDAQQGEVCRVVEIRHDRHPTVSISVPTTNGWLLGQRVRVVRVEEGA